MKTEHLLEEIANNAKLPAIEAEIIRKEAEIARLKNERDQLKFGNKKEKK